MIRAFILALQLLTRLPVPSLGALRRNHVDQASLVFPVITGFTDRRTAGWVYLALQKKESLRACELH